MPILKIPTAIELYTISEYQPDWRSRFERIASYLERFLDATCKIHHIGSTSIPGMPAKDIIDISIEHPSQGKTKIVQALQSAGYQHLGDLGLVGREAFKAISHDMLNHLPLHHLYACETGAYELKKHLAFKKYLIANRDRATWLANMKRLSAKQSNSKFEYIESKSIYYELITQESLDAVER